MICLVWLLGYVAFSVPGSLLFVAFWRRDMLMGVAAVLAWILLWRLRLAAGYSGKKEKP